MRYSHFYNQVSPDRALDGRKPDDVHHDQQPAQHTAA